MTCCLEGPALLQAGGTWQPSWETPCPGSPLLWQLSGNAAADPPEISPYPCGDSRLHHHFPNLPLPSSTSKTSSPRWGFPSFTTSPVSGPFLEQSPCSHLPSDGQPSRPSWWMGPLCHHVTSTWTGQLGLSTGKFWSPSTPGDLPEGCTSSGKGGFSAGLLFRGGSEVLGRAPGEALH